MTRQDGCSAGTWGTPGRRSPAYRTSVSAIERAGGGICERVDVHASAQERFMDAALREGVAGGSCLADEATKVRAHVKRLIQRIKGHPRKRRFPNWSANSTALSGVT